MSALVHVGDWVRVLRGRLQGSEGYVVAIYSDTLAFRDVSSRGERRRYVKLSRIERGDVEVSA